MINNIKNYDDEDLQELIRKEEEDLKNIKLNSKNLHKVNIQRMKVIIPKETNPKINPRDHNEKKDLKKICKLCSLEKPIEEFAVNYKYKGNNSLKFKNKCLNCYKAISKEYYKNNKEKLLKQLATKYDITKHKKYTVKLNFNSLEELEREFEKAKEQFNKGEIQEVKKKAKKDTDGGNSGSPNSAEDI